LTSQTLAARPAYSRAAFLALAGTLATVCALNAGSALRAFAGEPDLAPTPVIEAPPVEAPPSPPPPAFVFDTPLPGRVVNSPFGLRQLPWEENGRLHEGVDIAAPTGSAIRAATDGVVVRVGARSGSPAKARRAEPALSAHIAASAPARARKAARE